MKPLLMLQNITREGPGILRGLLEKYSIPYDIIDLSKNTAALPDPHLYGAVIVFGGPDSANDPTIKIKNELDFIRKILFSEIPYLGICLSMQLLAKAAGEDVIKCGTKEIGFFHEKRDPYYVFLTPAGREDPLFAELPEKLTVFHLHSETVTLAPDITLLATGNFCRNQVIKVGENKYGIQSHFELTMEMLSLWLREDPDLAMLNAQEVLRQFSSVHRDYEDTGYRLFTNFLKLSGYLQ